MSFIKKIVIAFLAAIVALVGELIISNLYFIFFHQEIFTNYFEKITPYLFLVVLLEEFFRYLAVKKISQTSKEIFFTALTVGLGFFLAEIIFRLSGEINSARINLDLLGVFLLHFTVSAFMAILAKHERLAFWKFILPAFVIHFAYNSLKIYTNDWWIEYAYLAIVAFALLIFYKKTKNLPIENS